MGLSPAGWVSKVLPDQPDVTKATPLALNLVEVERADLPTFLLGVISVRLVTPDAVGPFLKGNSRPSFLVTIPKEAVWTGVAIEALRANNMAFGGMGDLHRALRKDDPSDYVFKEYAYVEQRLRQHRSVIRIDRLYDRVWQIHRNPGNPLNIAISNAYDLTADGVRTAYDNYAPFDILFHTNNMGRITQEAHAAAGELGIELIRSDELFERLRR